MVAARKKLFPRLHALVERLPFLCKRDSADARLHCQHEERFSAERQVQLNALCEALLKKKELLASGKIQLVGLSKVKKRLGKRWKGMSKLVYDTVEEVIGSHLIDKADFFVLYKESNYLIFFASANPEQSREKLELITRDIQQRLFELDDAALRELEIWQTVQSQDAHALPDFDDFLDTFSSHDQNPPYGMVMPLEDEEDIAPPEIKCLDVEADDCVAQQAFSLEDVALPPIDIAYRPLWDVKRNALNTFLCMASPVASPKQCLQVHSALYEQLEPRQQAAMDLHLLRAAIAQAAKAVKEGRKILIACPLQHSSLHDYNFFNQFRDVMQKIPPAHRGHLLFYIMDVSGTLPLKDAYWFVNNLKHYCRFVFAEVPLRHDINFTYLRKRHVDAVGFRLDHIVSQKLSVDRMINLFHVRATAMKVRMTFVFGLSTVDSVTSAAISKYDYVCGDIIHNPVPEPQPVSEFRSEDLLVKLVKSGKA